MPSLFDPTRETELRQRLACLTPNAAARWGTMTAPRMVCHLIDAYSNTLGDNPTPELHGRLSNPIVRWLLIYVIPFPKGKAKTVKSYLRTAPSEWENDVATLSSLFTRLVARSREVSPTWTPHPAFAMLSTRDWGALIYKHTDHHFRQFGV